MTVALFFEMHPKPGHLDHYFAHVDRLRPHLARHDGLIDLERFRRIDDANAILSHQLWTGEDAILAWRRDREHRKSQTAGRNIHFDDYRIRVGPKLADGQDHPGACVVTVRTEGPWDAQGHASYESVTRPGQFITVASVNDSQAARHVAETAPKEARIAIFAVSRDYGLLDRAEAPAPE